MKLLTLLVLALCGLPGIHIAKSKVIAVYKNHHVTEDQFLKHYSSLAADEPSLASKEFSQLSPELKSALLKDYVKCLILEEEALKQKFDKSPEYKRKVEKYSKFLLREGFLEQCVKGRVSDEAIKNQYQLTVKKIKDNGEVKLQFMVFGTREGAETALSELRSGKNFRDVAKRLPPEQKSVDEARYFTCGELAPEMEAAVFGLAVGRCSNPIETASGWCIVKVVDKRPVKQLPSFDRMHAQIKQKLYLENRMRVVDNLSQSAEIRIMLD